MPDVVRVLAIASTDSHLKWTIAQRRRMPDDWVCEVVVLRGGGSPSRRQIADAVGTGGDGRPIEHVSLTGVGRRCRRFGPDVLILACPGPIVEAMSILGVGRLPSRPVVVAVTPGIALPVTESAIATRRIVDVFIAHSRAERRDYAAGFAAAGCSTVVALSRLPTLLEPRPVNPSGPVLFAPQALVPAGRDERRSLLERLTRRTDEAIIIHERTVAGETTAHRERHPYRSIVAEMIADGALVEHRIEFANGPMANSIRRSRCVVTISSTAAIEAAAAGVPIGIVQDFGVGDELLNSVFAESGCLIDLGRDGLAGVGTPDSRWADDHYLHRASDDDWIERILGMVADGRPLHRRRHTFPHRGMRWIVRSIAQPRTNTSNIDAA